MSIVQAQPPTAFSLQFRDAMAHLSAAVSIVTTNGIAGKIGLTVSSVCSVTDTPPTLLFCINKNSGVHDIIQENGKVCINVLNHQQEEMAKHFASMLPSTMEERFGWDMWDQGIDGLPILRDAISALQGDIIDTHSVGTHTIFMVQLKHIEVKPSNSLVYFGRQFKVITI
ncbi:4-hydroxyphenylacetate 3-monooxygenase, reductase component [[Haemophilus] ducreyi]|uniref:4-hydroxyphenylacetate 3-monooxygenase, reductase component n=1 Tax=Haemophilus ducreyi TaxID=730 RepID=UPI000655DE32|nr:4-hydroxyphenylacetate 3-monooxygenase, reductase component [[Haemophilus] ducreyi]AKO45328.1 4-hydroxyphenylacetate 3-monooxygenase [[Haemophilus] ducreyi]AKO46713.1 4-hydroxyphenylacetate 3-monooxygenase [[Haemophilus] ducreyi]AKO48054.1 4-hydroxyphenylacetate 3-monooxygenase [[Haemophilus] ducreyi]AKO49441.1 4-hydroxyphenylacetate 3-monooxygenase [[Haemophilus] ducreyi]ANF61522.1 4-hydroxyphenylacetate 3-monooxygenase [[Haemophilus] ducreyi]